MKVLFYIRANHEEVGGGDLTQIFETAKALKKLGLSISFSSDQNTDLKRFDIVHCFNSPRFEETLGFMQNAKKAEKPIALSTIFWSKEELAIGIARTKKVRLARKILGKSLSKKLWRSLKSTDKNRQNERELFTSADILLPNSEGEQAELANTYKLVGKKYQVVTNAIDGSKFKRLPPVDRVDYVLSVGRIENRKNTYKLIQACAEVGMQLKLIGAYDEGDDYAVECLKLAKKTGAEVLGPMHQDKIIHYYYEAKMHAMVSWYETPGLASMEAACGGCTIVSTDRGSTMEYFSDFVEYADPFSLSSIIDALKAANRKSQNNKLRNKILHEYTWEQAALDTLVGYRRIT